MAASILFRKKKLIVRLPRQFGGKTELGVRCGVDMLERARPGLTGLFLAKNTASRRKAAREKFLRVCPPHFAVNSEIIYNKRCKTTQLLFGSADKDPDANRGGTLAWFHWSEAAFSKIDHGQTILDVWQKIYRPMLSQRDGYAYIESTPNGNNGFKDLWDNAADLGFATFVMSLSQMLELGLITQEEYDKEKRETHPLIFDQEYEVKFVVFQGRTYDEFDERIHCVDVAPPKPWQAVVAAIDWGYHPSATCILFGYVQDGSLFVFDEIYAHRQLIEVTAEAIRERMQHWGIERLAVVADHEEDRNQELINRGIGVTKADKVNVTGNRLQIKEKLWKSQLFIDAHRCPFTKKDLQAAVWHDRKGDQDLDYTQCTWGHFDAEAALRYLVRAFDGYEAEEPEQNPHLTTDGQAAADWMLRRQHELEGFEG